ncbi:hypothetical protein BC830DRAFT_881329 [Chytriomyces sp. MP71]|nr:hypothetical protein BC830DRAFT_881329 [Chytriomyces sp. MP71]
MADDGTGLEQVIDPWVSSLWAVLPSVVAFDADKANLFAENASSTSPLKKVKPNTLETTTVIDASSSVVANGASPMDIVEPAMPDSVNVESTPMDLTPSPHAPSKIPLNLESVPESSEAVTGVAMLPTNYLLVNETPTSRDPSISKKSLFHLFDNKVAQDPFEYTANHLFASHIVAHRYLTGQKALKRVLEITLDIKAMNWQVNAGGVVGILAPNSDEVVLPLLKRLGVDGDKILDVSFVNPASGVGALPFVTDAPYTAYEAFRYFLDLNPPLRKPLLRVMAEYAMYEKERAALLHLTSPAGAALFKSLKQATPSFADLLATFPSVTGVPIFRILENLTRLQPRFYSVSKIDAGAGTISVAFNIVEYTHAVTGRPVIGLCSGYLESLTTSGQSAAQQIALFPKPNVVFAPPKDAGIPMVLIGAGTGITPFVSFLQSRAEVAKTNGGTQGVLGEAVLLHGRRFADVRDGDRIYGVELDEFVKDGVLTDFIEITSRDGDEGIKYVQHGIVLHGARIWKTIKDGGQVCVCGGVDMARDVHNALSQVVAEHGGFEGGDVAVKLFLKTLTSEGRYLKEIWS